jgi:hypothetical protein
MTLTIDAPADDTGRIYAYQVRIEACYDLLAAGGEYFGTPAYLDSARFPWWQHIVYHKGNAPIASSVAKLLASSNVVASNIDGIQLWIVAKAHGYNMGFSFTVHCCEPAKALAFQVFNLRGGKDAHLISFHATLLVRINHHYLPHLTAGFSNKNKPGVKSISSYG